MAILVPCPECGQQVEPTATDCAGCGALFSDTEKKALAYAVQAIEAQGAPARDAKPVQARRRPAASKGQRKVNPSTNFVIFSAVIAGAAFFAGRATAPQAPNAAPSHTTTEPVANARPALPTPQAEQTQAAPVLPSATPDDAFVQELKRERDERAIAETEAEYQRQLTAGNIQSAEALEQKLLGLQDAYYQKWKTKEEYSAFQQQRREARRLENMSHRESIKGHIERCKASLAEYEKKLAEAEPYARSESGQQTIESYRKTIQQYKDSIKWFEGELERLSK